MPDPNPDPELGSTAFISADGYAGQRAPGLPPPASPAPPEDGDDNGGDGRTVEEGDIYRVLGNGFLLNLNSYRGLQIIDLSNPAAPTIVGRLQVSGSPVELYVVGDRAIVLMNNWRGYYGQRGDVAVDTREGGLVMVVDISDRTAPVALDQAHVPGWIQTSRLAREGTQAALYVAASEWGQFPGDGDGGSYGARTTVKSFDVSGQTIGQASELDLGGYVTAIQATPEVLMVARQSDNWVDPSTDLSLIDISSPDGIMVEGDTVDVAGYVKSQFHMDFQNGMLRVFSRALTSDNGSSHLQTWDATNLAEVTPIDDEAFGGTDDLYAAIFLDNKAFAVTYLRVDPFHSFEIADDGQVTEISEFVVSGWNDFFRPVLDNTRLIGIGINDANGGRQLAVSLYDITDLTNIEPLLARAEVSGSANGWNWSEANWDHRAFSVLQDAISVQAPTGELETGLVLLPFSGWNDETQKYMSAVQIYTFSSSTLTRRGVMEHDTQVRRSFLANETTAANLSEAELSLFDPTNPDNPVALGSVALAPNYTNILAFGDYRARVNNKDDYYWYGNGDTAPAHVEIIAASEPADSATPVASFEIPGHAEVRKVGNLLVSIDRRVLDYNTWPYELQTTIDVFDLSNPRTPVRRGQLVTDELQGGYGYGYGYEDCFDCGWYRPAASIATVGNALTFLRTEQHEEPLGTEEVCYSYVDENPGCWDQATCTYWVGDYSCRSLNGGPEVCTGGFARCTTDNGSTTCEPVDQDEVEAPIRSSCNTNPVSRYWPQYKIDSVDLSNPDAPALARTVELPRQDEGVSLLAHGDDLYVTVKRPVSVPGDPRPYARYYIKSIDFSRPSDPELSEGINVPGELLAVDGSTIYTRNLVWGSRVAETAVARLELRDGLAYLRGHHRFQDRNVHGVTIDDRGLALVSHRPIWDYRYGYEPDADIQKLAILSPSNGLSLLSEIDVDSWAELRDVTAHRALYVVPGGLLVLNLEDPENPLAQAYFATNGWPTDFVVDDDHVLFAAGRYGIYDFSLDTFNLLPPE